MIFIAIYHMSAKVVSRGAGRSAVAASAYLSCSRMYNDYDGVQHDYTRKHGLVYQEVFLPPMAPPEWKDREQLWNAVERAEKTKDGRLAREFVVALPIELSKEAQISFLRDFIQKNFVDMGIRILLIWECVLILRSTTQTVIILIKTSEITLKNQKDFLKKLDVQYDNLSDQLTENQKRFQKIKADVTPEKSEELFDARVDERDTVRDQIYQKLYATMGQRFDASLFHESVSDIDHLLGEDLETFREQAYQKRALWKMERRKKQPVQLKKKVHDHER